ncbi:putative MRPL31-mitochondrial ribosomal protein, large subunit [Tilletiaria anomala UBC 951]|uniref:Large ribosomal subunit protein mL60 n=1 Tax=Tilletiaria anomala (strain ATCC 24038 / CBS 436.72 / UBC 951) TaxID=1037660 RepID=A0A066W2E0_TILAU|nr:putative MRPL31-mitochondrial ribosomal protein, large subunit [Tilletiaria anomala UBC 951]KDN45249.1 putative MRPL31-mitochondrial ribosomal protein, large subunit [Tilletiaria anomala UBC 951]
MFGAFRVSTPALGGLLWKNPWRLSATRKSRARERLRNVDELIATVAATSTSSTASPHSTILQRALALPTERQMSARDKYTTFSMRSKGYRKSVHKVPKWTRLTLRENPRGF